jgi:lipopolysaccharide biosynthesis glycosyltransferase
VFDSQADQLVPANVLAYSINSACCQYVDTGFTVRLDAPVLHSSPIGIHQQILASGRIAVHRIGINVTEDSWKELPPIVFAIDDRYVEPCCVALRSIANTTSDASRIDAYVLYAALRPESLRQLERNSCGLRLWLRQVDAVDRRFPVSDWVTEAVYLRLSIGTALPEFDKAIYFDADILVMGDIVPLMHTDLDGRLLGAVRDPQNPILWRGIALPGWDQLGLSGDHEYFNSGVMVLDLAKCREQRVFERCSSFLAERPQHIKFWDQDALNWVVGDDWLRLDRRWNTFPMSAILTLPGQWYNAEDVLPLAHLLADEDRADIVHFAGKCKPWSNLFPDCPIRQRYIEGKSRV